MIADTTFLVHLLAEQRSRIRGPASVFLADNRSVIRTSIISLAEVAISFPTAERAWQYFMMSRWSVYRLHDGVAKAAADLDRELRNRGRLGENDNWIAGFCRYYREPVISLDKAFDRVPGLRRIAY
jgi:predicted nucleic acid-binding protein